jgi:hypothetical protein
MIADLDETIKQLIKAELPIKNGEIDISFDQPKREWSAKLTKPAINLFLYDVRENAELRQHGWQRLPPTNGNGRVVGQKRMPFRVDCHYILTTWAAESEDEHRLLTRTMLVLFRHKIFQPEMLLGQLEHPIFPVSTTLARHDRLTNPAEVWSSLDNELRPSISYIVTLALDPWSEVTGPAVRSFTMRVGQAERPARLQQFVPDGVDIELVTIGGLVLDKAKDGSPQAGIEVAIKGTGRFTKTDSSGQYVLGTVPPGDYTLVVWPAKGKPKEKKVSVPADDGDYNLVL